MANEKVYSIKINGITQSIDAVEALKKQLDALDAKIIDLENRKINIQGKVEVVENIVNSVQNTNATSGQTQKGNLGTEVALQRELNSLKSNTIQLNAKIAEGQEEINKKLQATSELYKESNIGNFQDSIDSVEKLKKELDELDSKLSNLENRKVKVDSSLNTKQAKSTLSEDAKLLKNIQSTEEKIKTYSKDIYQNYLASKETLNKTLNDQKEIAAQERLQANTYTYTLNGLKQKLADIKQVMQTTEIGGDSFKKYQQEANELTTKLKELEAQMGVFGRNVGNYQSAADGFNKIKVAVGNTTREFANYRQAMKELMQERFQLSQSLGQESEQYKEVDLAIRKLESDYKDLDKSSKSMDNMLDTMETFTALGGIGTGLSQLFGFDNSTFDEAVKKLTSLLLILKSLETINKQWKSGDSPILNWFKTIDDKLEDFTTRKSRKAAQEFLLNFGDEIRSRARENFDMFGSELAFEDLKTQLELQGKANIKIEGQDLEEYWESLSEEQKKVFYENETLSAAMQDNMKKSTRAVKLLTGAFKVLRRALMGLASLGIGLLVTELLEKVANFIQSLDTSKTKAEQLNQELKALNKTLETERDVLGSQYLKKQINDEQYLKGIYESQNAALVKQLELVRELSGVNAKNSDTGSLGGIFASSNKNLEFTSEKISFPKTVGHGALGSIGTLGFDTGLFGKDLEVTVKNIEEVEKAWNQCQKAIKDGQDYLEANGSGFGDWFNSFFVTIKDTEEVMRGMGNIKLSDFISDFDTVAQQFKDGKISAEQYAEELKRLKNQMNDNQVLNSVIANLDKYIPDDKVREAVQNIINEITRLDDAFNMTSPAQVHYWNQVRIDGMKEGWKKTKATIDENERWEIVQCGRTEEQISLIQQKYARQRENARKNASAKYHKSSKVDGKKLADLEEELTRLRLNNLKDGLDKQLKLIEHEREVELKKKYEQLKELGKLTEYWSKFELEINKKYDKLKLDENRKWAFETLKIYQDLANAIDDVNRSTMEMEVGTSTQNTTQKVETKKTDVGKTLLTPTQYDNPQVLEEYYREVIKIEEAAAERQARIRQEDLDKQIDYEKKSEEIRHERLVNIDGGEFIEQLRAGKITKEDYDKFIEDENNAHYAKMNAIDKKYESDSKQTAIDTINETQKAYSDGYGRMIDVIKTEKAKIDEVMAQQPVRDKMGWGIVNIGATSANYKNALAQYEDLKNNIIAKQKELETALKMGKISPEDFAMRRSELKEEGKAIDEATKSIIARQKDLIGEFIASTQMYVQSIGNGLNQILSAVWAAQDAEYDNYMRQLEKQIDKAQELYDELGGIASQHADNMQDIESKIADAQGDARDRLVERYQAEKAARREALTQQKQAEKEKERLEKQKEKEEEAQRKREHKRQIVQAVINTALATVQGFATQPFVPVGLAMGALAASLGAAQIAIISSQKYAKGGVIQGKSHAEGGVKVLGGRAEVEGGEFITNKYTTTKNVEVLDYINSKHKRLTLDDFVDFYGGKSKVSKNVQSVKTKFASGGIIPSLRSDIEFSDKLATSFEAYSNRPTVVSVVDIIDRTQQVNEVRTMAGLTD